MNNYTSKLIFHIYGFVDSNVSISCLHEIGRISLYIDKIKINLSRTFDVNKNLRRGVIKSLLMPNTKFDDLKNVFTYFFVIR